MAYYHFNRKKFAEFIINKNPEIISNEIEKLKNDSSKKISIFSKGETILGYSMEHSTILSDIYGSDINFVKFFYHNAPETFKDEYEQLYEDLWNELEQNLNIEDKYYIIQIPSQNLNFLDRTISSPLAYNFCSGTVNYFISNLSQPLAQINQDLNINELEMYGVKKVRDELIEMGYRSFEKYYSQYHIAPATRERAPIIYQNWIKNAIDDENTQIICAFVDDDPMAFLTIENESSCIELVLSAVSEKMRGKKVYEDMIRYATNYCIQDDRFIVTSTQINNYLVQRAWINIGYKPYYTFYNYHIGSLKRNI